MSPWRVSLEWDTLYIAAASKCADVWIFPEESGRKKSFPHSFPPSALSSLHVTAANEEGEMVYWTGGAEEEALPFLPILIDLSGLLPPPSTGKERRAAVQAHTTGRSGEGPKPIFSAIAIASSEGANKIPCSLPPTL